MPLVKFFTGLFSNKNFSSQNYRGFFAAKVVKIEKHPNADRLRLVEVDLGDRTVWPVVCGAFNFQIGDLVVLALPGALIAQNIHTQDHQPFVLQNAKIRGVESQGMICAAFELGLAKEPGQGIMLLKNNVKPGNQFFPEMIKLDDKN